MMVPDFEEICLDFWNYFVSKHTLGITIMEIVKCNYLVTYGLGLLIYFKF